MKDKEEKNGIGRRGRGEEEGERRRRVEEEGEEKMEERRRRWRGGEVPGGLQLLPFPGLLKQLVGVQLEDHPQVICVPGAEK